jgi:hypothetical protein
LFRWQTCFFPPWKNKDFNLPWPKTSLIIPSDVSGKSLEKFCKKLFSGEKLKKVEKLTRFFIKLCCEPDRCMPDHAEEGGLIKERRGAERESCLR